jgi:long-chain acyl-CoA synthetase
MISLELLRRVRCHAEGDPRRPAYVSADGARTLEYAQLVERIDALAVAVAPQLSPGAGVLLRCGNRIEYPIWFLALLSCGADVLPVSTELADSELRQAAERIGAQAVVADDAARVALRDDVSTGWPIEFAIECPEHLGARVDRSPGNLLLASSGTTGQPKVVRRSAASLDAVSRNMAEAIEFSPADRVLASVPLTHSYGLEHGLLAPLWAGSAVRLCDGLDLSVMTGALAGGVTVFPAVPSMIEMLATLPDPSFKVTGLRVVYSAGAPLPEAVYERFRERFDVRVGQLYGMTEIGSVTFGSPSAPGFDPKSVGQPMRDVSIRILNDAGEVALTGEDGEVAVRAPSMFDGYLRGEAQLIDGHFATGDLGHLDAAGNLTITGRMRMLIDTGGMKINPVEVESVLGNHPDVAECAIVPLRQSETVQRLRAVIVPRDVSAPPSSESIRAFVRQRLAGYKVPRLIEFRSALPRTATG